MGNDEQILIYKTPNGVTSIDVRIKNETVWLNQNQMAELFDHTKQNISLHINNIFKEGELDKFSTVKEYLTVQKEGSRTISRKLKYYNLDIIISVGYRIKSLKGTQFRQWANKILKEYLIKGFSVNEKLLRERTQQLQELKNAVLLQEKVVVENHLNSDQSIGLIKIIAQYSKALDLLDRYDYQLLSVPEFGSQELYQISYFEARKAIDKLALQTFRSKLFGIEKDDSFKGSLENIYQTFDGKDLYKTLEEKAAHLLYFVVKNHSFTDGNKRIAAYLFVWFLDKNHNLINKFGAKIITDHTLVALTLLIAESNPLDKEMMIKITVNLLSNSDS